MPANANPFFHLRLPGYANPVSNPDSYSRRSFRVRSAPAGKLVSIPSKRSMDRSLTCKLAKIESSFGNSSWRHFIDLVVDEVKRRIDVALLPKTPGAVDERLV